MKLILALGAVAGLSLTALAYRPIAPSQAFKAPELAAGPWLNTPGGKPITLASRKGSPTLVAYWTFACSNCQANLPAYARLYKAYKPKGVELIAIHTPELPQERKLGNVEAHVKRFGIDYPVLVDTDGKNWNRWKQEYWPTLYLLDGQGRIRYRWVGELQGDEPKVSAALDRLLLERQQYT